MLYSLIKVRTLLLHHAFVRLEISGTCLIDIRIRWEAAFDNEFWKINEFPRAAPILAIYTVLIQIIFRRCL